LQVIQTRLQVYQMRLQLMYTCVKLIIIPQNKLFIKYPFFASNLEK
jgi:hypothetical protein